MTFRRLAALALIFVGASLGWTVLGSSLVARTGQFDDRLEREVELLWGAPHRQTAPEAWIQRPMMQMTAHVSWDEMFTPVLPVGAKERSNASR